MHCCKMFGNFTESLHVDRKQMTACTRHGKSRQRRTRKGRHESVKATHEKQARSFDVCTSYLLPSASRLICTFSRLICTSPTSSAVASSCRGVCRYFVQQTSVHPFDEITFATERSRRPRRPTKPSPPYRCCQRIDVAPVVEVQGHGGSFNAVVVGEG